ncbi:MAG TPA: hypothetical protein VFS86_01255 [Rhodanobacteraceae bacterium]|nr:hypothetical protein [Rhodanobacteraceae bacterium]
MMLKRTSIAIALSLASALALSACNKSAPEQAATAPAGSTPAAPVSAPAPQAPVEAPAPVTLVSVDLGSAVGADQKVTTATTTFTPKDTIYASVATTGTGTATIEAKWTYQGSQTVKDDSKTIAPTGPASTAFSISKPDGWPAGNYKVDISLNGTQVASKDFSVQ